ncbi:MAG: AAA family ATPase [Alistipes sp.]|nr:AAA family ATPase [Alistipes sp.]
MDNHNVGGNSATRTPLLGASLKEMLDFTSGKAPSDSSAQSPKSELYEELKPKYNHEEVRERIEQNCRYNAIKPHLIDASANIPDPIPIISRYGSVIASEGNISAIVGAAKSKKTFLCTALVGALLRPSGTVGFGIAPSHKTTVLWVDTEQSASHVLKVIQRIHRMAGVDETAPFDRLQTLTLREVEPKERFNILRDAIAYYRPRLVVVDGISDLMYNSNCIEESDAVVGEFMALTTEYNCHIMSVLHTNPNSDKARGHIGSTLQRKVETMIYVRKVGERSVVEPQYCRNEEFAPFAFHVTEEGLPEECEMPNEHYENEKGENVCVKIIREGYPNGIERKVLITKLVDETNISRAYARVKLSRVIAQGLLIERGGLLYLRN